MHKKPWAQSTEEILQEMAASAEDGLSEEEARKRLRKHGKNRIRRQQGRSAWRILTDQFKNLIVFLLAAAAGLSFAFAQWLEGISICAALLINASIGFFTELQAVRSMEALHKMTRVKAKVLRDASVREIPDENLVPGDLVVFEGGDIVSADLRILEASRLQADESALTGESLPAGKQTGAVAADAALADRKNMLFKGTFITRGSGRGVVTAIGMDTELGKVAAMTDEGEGEHTPLEKRLNRLAYRLVWVTLIVSAFVAVSGLIGGEEIFLIIETAIALAVAAIPEGLPIVATVALARGMWRMAEHHAVMNRLSAVETLGATGVICTDKTGTLTENRMTVCRIALVPETEAAIAVDADAEDASAFRRKGETLDPDANPALLEILETGVLCNNASYDDGGDRNGSAAVGDPLEAALLAVGRTIGLERDRLLEAAPEVREEAFDPELKMMATFHQIDGGYRVAVKGAPEAVLEVCTAQRKDKQQGFGAEDRKRWLACNDALAETGLRIIAAGTKRVSERDAEPYTDLTFLGLIAMLDPPRADVGDAIDACRKAGIRVVMVTGDQSQTATHIGRSLGLVAEDAAEALAGRDLKPTEDLSEDQRRRLLGACIFARVSPEQKLYLIQIHQENGSIVAMTGDGVNDAPALKKADIGIAMGKRGTQVAREAADMVLKDDAFNTIVVAISQGRAIFDNIRKFILFLLSGNMGEIMIVTFALLFGAPLPLLPLQILYLNMIGDVFPALALGVGKGETSKMEQPPRDAAEPVLTNQLWVAVFGYGLLIALPVLGGFAVALNLLNLDRTAAVTISFLTLAFARLWHVFNMRDAGSRLFCNDVTRNPFVWEALALCILLLLGAIYVPGLSDILKMVAPGFQGWLLILGMSLVPLVVGQVFKIFVSI